MSVRKKPEKAVPLLLDQLKKVETHILNMRERDKVRNSDLAVTPKSKLNKIQERLEKMRVSMSRIENWEKNVLDKFCDLEKALDEASHKSLGEVQKCFDGIDKVVEELESYISTEEESVTLKDGKMGPEKQQDKVGHGESEAGEWAGEAVSEVWAGVGAEDEIMKSETMCSLWASIHCPERAHLRMCLLWLTVLPENRLIKKRCLIYWWMGEGVVSSEEKGEEVLQQLLEQGFVIAKNKRGGGSFTLCPLGRRMLIALTEKLGIFEFSPLREGGRPRNGNRRAFLPMDEYKDEVVLTVFNIDEQSPAGTKLEEWLRKQERLEVLQMGRWQDSATHHIEVAADKYNQLLEAALESKKHLRYLSLRGISGIETLPAAAIRKLVSLRILDVRACHNLQRLPHTISGLTNLTHLDMSECYLLEGMPEGLHLLRNLQVLKGFLVGRDSSEIAHLAELQYLRKLRIRVRHEGGKQLGCLGNFSKLLTLTIFWMGDADPDTDVAEVKLPSGLTKLDLRFAPFKELPKWLEPSKLQNLEKLHIKGGHLTELPRANVYSSVKSLRLQSLADLHINEPELVARFPNYMYLEKTKCYKDDQDIILPPQAP